MDNKNNIEQFDKLFNEKFKDASVKAPEGVWEAVSGNIASGASSSWIAGKAIIVKTAISVATITAVSIGVYKSIEKKEVVENTDAIEEVFENKKESLTIDEPVVVAEEEKVLSLKEVVPVKEPLSDAIEEVKDAVKKVEEVKTLDQLSSASNNDKVNDRQEKAFTPFNGVIPDLKPFYCKGQMLQVDLVGTPTDVTWYLNETQIEIGRHLDLNLNRTGVFHLMLKQRNETVYDHKFTVHSVDAKFQVNTIDDGTYMLVPNDHNNKAVWNANDGKGYRMSPYGSLSITDFTRERIPVTLIIESAEGCMDSTKQSILNPAAKEENILRIPDAFIPGGDGFNDHFVIEIEHETSFQLKVTNSAGMEMFSSTDKNNSWDGKIAGELCKPGDYYYQLEYTLKGSEKQLVKRGVVRLLLEKD